MTKTEQAVDEVPFEWAECSDSHAGKDPTCQKCLAMGYNPAWLNDMNLEIRTKCFIHISSFTSKCNKNILWQLRYVKSRTRCKFSQIRPDSLSMKFGYLQPRATWELRKPVLVFHGSSHSAFLCRSIIVKYRRRILPLLCSGYWTALHYCFWFGRLHALVSLPTI